MKIFKSKIRGEKYRKMTVKGIYEILMGIVGISGLAALCVVLLIIVGIFV